jgi:hypothetical protein
MATSLLILLLAVLTGGLSYRGVLFFPAQLLGTCSYPSYMYSHDALVRIYYYTIHMAVDILPSPFLVHRGVATTVVCPAWFWHQHYVAVEVSPTSPARPSLLWCNSSHRYDIAPCSCCCRVHLAVTPPSASTVHSLLLPLNLSVRPVFDVHFVGGCVHMYNDAGQRGHW